MKNKHLIQRLENREDLTEKEMIKLIDEPTYKDVEDGINKTIKSHT